MAVNNSQTGRNMPDMLRSALLGLTGGLLSFAASGWIVYSALWRYTGQDKIMRDDGGTPGVVLGGYGCFVDGVISGAVIGIITAVLITLYLYRRQRREDNPQSAR